MHRIVSTIFVSTGLALALGACRAPEPPPAGAEDALRWLYRNLVTATDAEIVEALGNFEAALAPGTDGRYAERLETTLATTDLAGTALTNDPATTFGILAAGELPCPLDTVVPLHVALNQQEIHGGYTEYERTYATTEARWPGFAENGRTFANAVGAWPAQNPFLAWDTDYAIDSFGANYRAKIHGMARSVVDGSRPAGRIVVGRAWLKEPATFPNGGSDYFRQDYQLDLYYERDEGRTVHVFAAWREMKIAFFSPEDMAGVMLGTAGDADARIAERCRK